MARTTRTIELDGMNYSLIAGKSGDRFHSFWTCEPCDQCGYCQDHDSIDAVLFIAEHKAKAHHHDSHSG